MLVEFEQYAFCIYKDFYDLSLLSSPIPHLLEKREDFQS